jgi:hypothetical protein
MSVTHVVGVDPGLVHTGVVQLCFRPERQHITISSHAVVGCKADEVQRIVTHAGLKPDAIFIEGYRPRSNLNSDKRMVEGVAEIRKATKGTVLLNTGVKKVVKKSLMELLGVWSFSTVTNHQDLRSAARIALLGMLKDEQMNRLLSDIVRDHLEGRDWHVAHG